MPLINVVIINFFKDLLNHTFVSFFLTPSKSYDPTFCTLKDLLFAAKLPFHYKVNN